MLFKKNAFSLQEIADHIATEVLRADIDFQSKQQKAWHDLRKVNRAYAGFSKQEALALDEINCTLNLSPIPPSWLYNLKSLFNIPIKPNAAYFTLAKEGAVKTTLSIKISIKREKAGQYSAPEISATETTLKPENIHVLDFIK